MTDKTAGEVFNDLQQIANFIGWQASEIERLKAGFESEEPQEYCHNEVTGLHNMADLYEIERLQQDCARIASERACLQVENKKLQAIIDEIGAQTTKARAALSTECEHEGKKP